MPSLTPTLCPGEGKQSAGSDPNECSVAPVWNSIGIFCKEDTRTMEYATTCSKVIGEHQYERHRTRLREAPKKDDERSTEKSFDDTVPCAYTYRKSSND